MFPKRVNYRFFTDDEISKVSICELKSPVSFDRLGHPVPTGLYDQRLGPTEPGAKCVTCGLNYKHCPGHLGHIELSCPVYNPLLFKQMFRLIRVSCWQCHKFKLHSEQSKRLHLKLRMIEVGLLSEAKHLDRELLGTGGEASESSEDVQARIKRIMESYEDEIQNRSVVKIRGLARDYRQQLVREYMKSLPTKKCQNCNVVGEKFRQEGYSKIFRVPLTKKDLNNNRNVAMLPEDDEQRLMLMSNYSTTQQDSNATYVLPEESETQLKRLWQNESDIVSHIFNFTLAEAKRSKFGSCPVVSTSSSSTYKIFFLRRIAVPPPRFRPPQKINGESFEHAQSVVLGKAISTSQALKNLYAERDEEEEDTKTSSSNNGLHKDTRILRTIVQLQETVNGFMDSTKASRSNGAEVPNGVRQLLEKKQGLFRMNMMGKRVNFAARSVISPDPNLSTHEIGVPLRFAKELTYAQPVTDFNVEELRKLVINGAHQHPGANFVEDEKGRKTPLDRLGLAKRKALAKTLQTPSSTNSTRVKRVWRHLRNGDVMLINRQPTLHKSSIMANHARVLPTNNQVIRFHYSNCNALNADFDGDEINIHFPQNELARAEAYEIAGAMFQYTAAKDGKPLRGLIQDHVDMAVLLTKRDTFLTRDEYQELVYVACANVLDVNPATGEIIPIELERPAMIKPKCMWTGKQVISTILKQLLGKDQPKFGTESSCKVKFGAWGGAGGKCSAGDDMDESKVLVHQSELLRGVLDKSQIGHAAYGLVHSVYELYGARRAGRLLTALGQLLTKYLKLCSHTCGMDDLVLLADAEKARDDILRNVAEATREPLHEFLFGDTRDELKKLPYEKWKEHARVATREKLRGDPTGRAHAELDSMMQGRVGKTATEVIDACLPSGLYKKFPSNRFQLMVATGAKGSNVNASQISCLLGQQVLEGRRVPLMVSGRSLPCFDPYDPHPRSGGYIADRYLTGVRPQEYFFHSMSGREGLIDTAVKTANSGYLQRCLVKHMEDLRVEYDGSVRNCDGSVVQFLYGDDGIDASQAAYMDKLKFAAYNFKPYMHKFSLHDQVWSEAEKAKIKTLKQMHRAVDKAKSAFEINLDKLKKGDLVECRRGTSKREDLPVTYTACTVKKVRDDSTIDLKFEDGRVAKHVKLKNIKRVIPDPVLSKVKSIFVGAISESAQKSITEFIQKNPLLFEDGTLSAAAFRLLMWVKFGRMQVHPGEAVGCLAAQGIGEPSTQMTLNTFHLAGTGVANVTLGIPRLREILMTASQKIKTPTMELTLRLGATQKMAEKVCMSLSRLHLKELLSAEEGIVVRELETYSEIRGAWVRRYKIRLNFVPEDRIRGVFGITFMDVLSVTKTSFIPKLLRAVAFLQRFEGERVDLSQGLRSAVDTSSTKKKSSDGSREMSESEDEEDEDDEDQGTLRFGNKKDVRGYGDDDDDDDISSSSSSSSSSDSEDEEAEDAADFFLNEKTNKKRKEKKKESKQDDGTIRIFDGIVGSESEHFGGMSANREENFIEISIEIEPERQKLHLIRPVLETCEKVDVRSTDGIQKVHVLTRSNAEDNAPYLHCEGVNMKRVWSLQGDVVNTNMLKTNDIGVILHHYGVEACRAHIVEQVASVFGVYGIKTDERHLGLVADYMTQCGGFRPMNRLGMDSSASPLLQMSFETTTRFLTQAASTKTTEVLESPSARISFGQPIKAGTGAFDLLQPVGF